MRRGSRVTIRAVFPEFLELVRERERSGESIRTIATRLAKKYQGISASGLRAALQRHPDGMFLHEQRIFTDKEERDIAGIAVS